jgi:hypothetical protein
MKPLAVSEKKTYHTVDELDISGALRIAVASSVLGTSLVVGVFGLATISVHLDEVESTVKTARKLGDIDIKRELAVEQVELLVVRGASGSHKVDTGTNVLLLSRSDKLEGQGVTAGGNTVSTYEGKNELKSGF